MRLPLRAPDERLSALGVTSAFADGETVPSEAPPKTPADAAKNERRET